MNALRPTLALVSFSAALAAQANLINFDSATGAVGNAYLTSDGLSFTNGETFAYPTAPSGPNVLAPQTATMTVSSPSNDLVGSVGFVYSSNSVGSGTNVATPTFSVYGGVNGTGALLATALLPDTSTNFTVYAPISLSFVGAARSFVLRDTAPTHILLDNLSFTPQAVPEPSALAALGFGGAAVLRRKGKR